MTALRKNSADVAKDFARRHIGPSPRDIEAMLETVRAKSLKALMDETLPASIRQKAPLKLAPALSETQALSHMTALAAQLGVRRLHALCHPQHRASWRVMEKCGFQREGILTRHTVFPNLSPEPEDVLSVHSGDRIPIQADVRADGVDVAPEPLHRMMKTECGATTRSEQGIHGLREKFGGK